MNAELVAVMAEERDVKGSNAIRAAHDATIEDLWTRQQCTAKVEICPLYLHRLFEKLESKCLKAGFRKDKSRSGTLVISEIANKLSQFQQNIKPRACVQDSLLQYFPDNNNIPSDEEQDDDQI